MCIMTDITKFDDGVYCNTAATFYIKDQRIIMKLWGQYYNMNRHFIFDVQKISDLTDADIALFDIPIDELNKW